MSRRTRRICQRAAVRATEAVAGTAQGPASQRWMRSCRWLPRTTRRLSRTSLIAGARWASNGEAGTGGPHGCGRCRRRVGAGTVTARRALLTAVFACAASPSRDGARRARPQGNIDPGLAVTFRVCRASNSTTDTSQSVRPPINQISRIELPNRLRTLCKSILTTSPRVEESAFGIAVGNDLYLNCQHST